MMSKNGIRRHNPLEKTRTRVFDRLHARDPCVKLAVQSELFFKFIPTVSCDSELSIKKTCEHTTDFVIIRKILMTTRICFHFLSRSRWMHQGGKRTWTVFIIIHLPKFMFGTVFCVFIICQWRHLYALTTG